jgi:hypothetical protein
LAEKFEHCAVMVGRRSGMWQWHVFVIELLRRNKEMVRNRKDEENDKEIGMDWLFNIRTWSNEWMNSMVLFADRN